MGSKAASSLAVDIGACQGKADPTVGVSYPDPEAHDRAERTLEWELHSCTMWPCTSHNPSLEHSFFILKMGLIASDPFISQGRIKINHKHACLKNFTALFTHVLLLLLLLNLHTHLWNFELVEPKTRRIS